MKYLSKILVLILFMSVSFGGYSQNRDFGFDEEKSFVELTINGESFKVQNLPQEGIVEIFNILGSKVMSFSVRGGVNINRINLPEGYYILKSDNITRKIVVK